MPLDVLMIAYAAFAVLAIAMKRHRPTFGHGIVDLSPQAWRIGGAILLALSFLLALHRIGPAQGPVTWLGSISLAAILLVFLMSWRPIAAFALAMPALVLAGLLASLA